MTIRPYPALRLTKISRAQLRAHATLDALWREDQRDAVEATLRNLLGHTIDTRLDIQIGPAEFASSERGELAGSQLALLIEPVGLALPHTFVFKVTYADAHYLVARTLGGEGADPERPEVDALDDLSAGVLAYVSARVLAALGGGLRLRDLMQGPSSTMGSTLDSAITKSPSQTQRALGSATAQASVAWPICVRLPGRTLHFALHMPELQLAREPSRPQQPIPTRRYRHDLSALPVTLIASAGHVTLPLSAVRSLELGDIVMLDETDLALEPRGVRGHAALQLAGSAHRIMCALQPYAFSIENFVRPPHTQGNNTVTTGQRIPLKDTSAEAGPNFADDAPIELSLTLARFKLTLGELQHLRVGDVLRSGRALGERVSLCVSNHVVADGELVDVDGELGVRILQVHSEPTRSAGQ